MALVKSTFLEKRVAIKSTLPLNIVSTELTSPLNSVPLKVTFSINLDLEHAIIDRVEYGNVEFKSDNRGTFLTLKSAALKKNDQIKALE
jgi:hypothetical protein